MKLRISMKRSLESKYGRWRQRDIVVPCRVASHSSRRADCNALQALLIIRIHIQYFVLHRAQIHRTIVMIMPLIHRTCCNDYLWIIFDCCRYFLGAGIRSVRISITNGWPWERIKGASVSPVIASSFLLSVKTDFLQGSRKSRYPWKRVLRCYDSAPYSRSTFHCSSLLKTHSQIKQLTHDA